MRRLVRRRSDVDDNTRAEALSRGHHPVKSPPCRPHSLDLQFVFVVVEKASMAKYVCEIGPYGHATQLRQLWSVVVQRSAVAVQLQLHWCDVTNRCHPDGDTAVIDGVQPQHINFCGRVSVPYGNKTVRVLLCCTVLAAASPRQP